MQLEHFFPHCAHTNCEQIPSLSPDIELSPRSSALTPPPIQIPVGGQFPPCCRNHLADACTIQLPYQGECQPACFMIGKICVGGVHEAQKTNRRNRGRSSADRRTKPTLMLTEPRSIFKSSTKDLSLPSFEICFSTTGPSDFGQPNQCNI